MCERVLRLRGKNGGDTVVAAESDSPTRAFRLKCAFYATFREPGRRHGERPDPPRSLSERMPARPDDRADAQALGYCGHQLLSLAFKVQTRVLVGFRAGKRRDPLHKIKDALCRALDYAD